VPAAKYTQEQRDEALALYHTDGPTAVEKKLGIPKGTVTRWAKETGVETVSVSIAHAGTEAASAYARRRRAELAVLLLDDAHKLRAQLWQPALVHAFGGKDNTYEEHVLAEPTFTDKKNIISAVSTAVVSVTRLEDYDKSASDGATAADSVVDRLMQGFRTVYEAGQ